jgi:polyisoprenoid-binding protein YceI
MGRIKRLLVLIAACVGVGAFLTPQPVVEKTFDIDPALSSAKIDVGKSGPLSFVAGHSHEVDAPGIRGRVRVWTDGADVAVTIPVSSMRVTGAHESADDLPKIQQTMMSGEVLDAQNHPTISFQSTSVVIRSRAAAALDAVVEGRMTLRGRTQAVSVPVHVDLGGQMLTATGRFVIRQTDYGIKPISVGGVVAVKDTVAITFHIAGRQAE